jgi:hypothetical protein
MCRFNLNGTGDRASRLQSASSFLPFVLSLSKHRPFFRRKKKGQPFDKLRANGSDF